MPLTSISELRHFLDTLGVRPKKSLSQNFLVDGNVLRKILQEAHVSKGECVLDIGAGPGAFTEALLETGAKVIAIEQDAHFAHALKRFEAEVFHGDVREYPFDTLSEETKIVANLPYHLAVAILTKLVPRRDLFSTITVIIQEEMARRICALPNTREYGSLTVYLNFYATPKYAFRVGRNCFFPKPKVDSAVVTLTLKEPPETNREAFFEFVRASFQQRRKKLTNNLKELYEPSKVIEVLQTMGFDENVRGENLSLNAFLKLFESIT